MTEKSTASRIFVDAGRKLLVVSVLISNCRSISWKNDSVFKSDSHFDSFNWIALSAQEVVIYTGHICRNKLTIEIKQNHQIWFFIFHGIILVIEESLPNTFSSAHEGNKCIYRQTSLMNLNLHFQLITNRCLKHLSTPLPLENCNLIIFNERIKTRRIQVRS